MEVFTEPVVSLSPEITMTEPSPSSVAVGYQRPAPMPAVAAKDSVAGLNAAVSGSPRKLSYFLVPPRTNGLPSGRITIPLQNMSQVRRKVRTVCVGGSHTP